MRALLCHAFGPPETLRVGSAGREPCPDNAVRIAVAAAGANFADILMVAGEYQRKPPFPFSPGLEAAGTVTEVGAQVRRVKLGERVMALVDHGAFREELVALERDVIAIPDAMDFVTAAGFGISYDTAHGAFAWRARLEPGETVLVTGAAGGVGLAAVEVAKAMGARVIAAAGSAEKCALALAHGADHAIDYRHQPLRDALKSLCPRGIDVLFDPVGGDVYAQALRAAAFEARLVVIGFASGERQAIPANILLVKNVSAIGFAWTAYRRDRPAMMHESFAQIFTWWQQGCLKPLVSEVMDLAEAPKALARIKDRAVQGKIVLTTACP